MSTFTTTKLAGHRVLVQGDTPEQSTILDSTRWDELNAVDAFAKATEFYNEQVKEFFAPVIEAADKAEAIVKEADAEDEAFVLTLQEAVPATKGKSLVREVLDHDTAVLRLIESGDTSRLIWVGATIEIIAL